MKVKSGNYSHGWFVLFLSLVCFSTTFTPVAEANQPPSCLMYAYTEDAQHFFLIQDDSNLYGNNVIVKHNCQNVRVFVDGEFLRSSSENFSFELTTGKHDLIFETDNYTLNYSNVNFMPSSFNWLEQYQIIQEELDKNEYTKDEVKTLSNWVSFGSGIIIFMLSVGIYWRLINHYVDRNHIEEVL